MNKKIIKQVSTVIGKKRALHELNLAARDTYFSGGGVSISFEFMWQETPQGWDFWYDIDQGKWPYTYKTGE
jgi:hypothetical protein